MKRITLHLIGSLLAFLVLNPVVGAQPAEVYLQCDGIDDYVEVPDHDNFSVTAAGLTVAAWMKPGALYFPRTQGTGYVHWLGKGERRTGEPAQHEWTFRIYSKDNTDQPNRENRISFYVFNLAGGTGIGSRFQDPVAPGGWIHVVGIADNVQTRTYIYKNGEFRDCDQYGERGREDQECDPGVNPPPPITPENGMAPLRIGTRDIRESYFLGGLAEVRVWNRPLTAGEVADLYALNRVPQDGLVAEYLLNEGTGRIALDTVGGQDGTISGGYRPIPF